MHKDEMEPGLMSSGAAKLMTTGAYWCSSCMLNKAHHIHAGFTKVSSSDA